MNNWPKDTLAHVDLTNCEREPIHIPGQIQPHGLLLAADLQSLSVVQWSINALAELGVAAETLRGCFLVRWRPPGFSALDLVTDSIA